jgi:hypothetical protein
LQCFDRGAPGCRRANDEFEPCIPDEVCLPALVARMKQINDLMCDGIARPGRQGKSRTVGWIADGHTGLVIDGTNNEEPRLSQNIGAPLSKRQLEALDLVRA